MLECTASNLAETIWPLVKADIPVFIHGLSGIGKSQIIREQLMPMVAKEYGESVLHDFRLSSKDTVDGTGMPVIVDEGDAHATKWTRPAFIPKEDNRMHIVFLDEVGHSSVQMQHAVGYQLTLDRALGEFKLPKKNRVILALNTRDAKGGDNKLAKPFENRGAHVLMKHDVKGWIEWAKSRNLDPRLIAFIRLRPAQLHMMDDNQPAWPSPRSVEMLSRVMDAPLNVIRDCATATCGKGFAAEFHTFLKDLMAELPTPAQIKADPTGAKVPKETHLQFVVASAISQLITPKDVDIWAKYLARLEADLRSMAAHNAMERDANLKDNPALKKLVMA